MFFIVLVVQNVAFWVVTPCSLAGGHIFLEEYISVALKGPFSCLTAHNGFDQAQFALPP
jgi:hypothetical protein